MFKTTMRVSAVLLSAVLIAAACGSDSDDAAEPSSTAAATTEVATTAMESSPTTEAAMPAEETTPAADETMLGTVVEVAVESGSFPTLVAAVQAAGLVDVLNSEGPFTVLAPTEEAFAAALAALDVTADDLLANTELLTAVLTYHVLPLEAPAEVVVSLDGQSVATVNGAEIAITIEGDSVKINNATVVATDIKASNGVIHVIDTVLLPPSGE